MSHIYENDTKPILSDPPYLLQFILSVVLSVLCGATIMFMWNWFVVARASHDWPGTSAGA